MTSICQTMVIHWKSTISSQGTLENSQGGGKPFDTWRDGESSNVNYQRSYDLSENLSIDTYLLLMDPMDHFHLLAEEDDLVDCFLHLPILEHVLFVFSYETIAQAHRGNALLQHLHEQKPNKSVQQLLVPNTTL
jgi:hypothetical protein